MSKLIVPLILLCIYITGSSCTATDTASKKPIITDQTILITEEGLEQSSKQPIKTTWSLYETVGSEQRKIHYSITESKFNKYLVISNRVDSIPVVELIYLGKKSKVDSDLEQEINSRREAWMEVCNSHQAVNLIQSFYTNPPYYYNHKPLVKNQDQLIREYSYMNDSKYHLELTPLHMEAVNNNLVYEIGQCKGSYGGKYVIVWRKEQDGSWNIHLDSNI